jgi:hypothetical protein
MDEDAEAEIDSFSSSSHISPSFDKEGCPVWGGVVDYMSPFLIIQ